MAFRLDFSRIQQVDADGAPLSGAKLYVYQNETTTKVTLYSDRAGSNIAANPIIADSSGRFPVRYVAADDLLTFDLDTAADADVWSDDDMEPVPNTDGALQASSNLSDLDSAATARANLGLGELATIDYADLSALSAPDPFSDVALVYDSSAGEWKKILFPNLRPTIPIIVAVGDETTALTTGAGKIKFRTPSALGLLHVVRASLGTASSSGAVTVDINADGSSILSTKLSIDQGEKTSVTAATAAVVSNPIIGDDVEITIDIDDAGSGAAGLKVTLYTFNIST